MNLIRFTLATVALATIVFSEAQADDLARACALSPYHVGDKLTRYGFPGDQTYDRLIVRKVYVSFGPPHPSQCLAIHCPPTPAYVQRIEGWLYRTSATFVNGPRIFYTWNWYSRGLEMDAPLDYVQDSLAAVVLRNAHACLEQIRFRG